MQENPTHPTINREFIEELTKKPPRQGMEAFE
jgi:hypothetical protein